MSDPYRAHRHRTVAPQRVSELDEFCGRLRAVGATPAEIDDVRATWDDFDADWTPARRRALVLSSDAELRAELVATRDEYTHDTTTQQEQDASDVAGHLAATERAAHALVGTSPARILAWVGEDPIRAIAMHTVESGPSGGHDPALIGALEAILDPPSEGVDIAYVVGEFSR